MKYKIGSGFLITFTFVLAESLWAHHSAPAVFDMSKNVTVIGTLTKVDWRNPHIEISLETKGDRGQAETWVMETAPPAWFRVRNVNKSDFDKAIGRTVSIEAFRARDGSRYGILQKIKFPDGRSVVGYIQQ